MAAGLSACRAFWIPDRQPRRPAAALFIRVVAASVMPAVAFFYEAHSYAAFGLFHTLTLAAALIFSKLFPTMSLPLRARLLLLPLLCLSFLTAVQAASAARRPNFLFIITDDQSAFWLKAYEPNSMLRTPVLDRLAAGGMVIEHAHQMGAFVSGVCTPSRHMVMTGRTLWHLPASLTSRIYADYPSTMCPPDIAQQSLPAVFNRAG